MQEHTCFAVGYRPMTAMINKEFGSNFNKKRIHRIMVNNNLSSIVRPRKYTPEQYKKRKQMKLDKPKDLLKETFFQELQERCMLKILLIYIVLKECII